MARELLWEQRAAASLGAGGAGAVPGCCFGAISASRQLPAPGQSCACLRHGDEKLGVRPSLLRVSGGHGLLGWENELGELPCSAGSVLGLQSGTELG